MSKPEIETEISILKLIYEDGLQVDETRRDGVLDTIEQQLKTQADQRKISIVDSPLSHLD